LDRTTDYPVTFDEFAKSHFRDGKAKIVKCEARKFRGMRRTWVRRSDEIICRNEAVGDFLRRHHLWRARPEGRLPSISKQLVIRFDQL
jgi:hypothetical protein